MSNKIPMIEQFYMKEMERFRFHRVVSSVEGDNLSRSTPIPLILHDLRKSVKYRFSPSAGVMHTRLYDTPRVLPDFATDLIGMGLARTWIEFETYIIPADIAQEENVSNPFGALYATQFPPYPVSRQIRGLTDTMLQFAQRFAGHWYIAVILPDYDYTTVVSAFYLPVGDDDFRCFLPPWYHCVFNECEYVNMDNPREASVIPCSHCWEFPGTCLRHLALALGMAHGDFAESAEPPEPRSITENYTPGQKKGSEKISLTYKLVTFDASVKKVTPSRAEPLHHRGSWLEIDPDAIIYVSRHMLATKRMLDPERNPRWKKKQVVAVRAHQKKIPMKMNLFRQIKAEKK